MGVRTDAGRDGFETGADCDVTEHTGTTRSLEMGSAHSGCGHDASFTKSDHTSASTTATSTPCSSMVYYHRVAYTD